jgi:hypothetical protein
MTGMVLGFVFSVLLLTAGTVLALQTYKHHRYSSEGANVAMMVGAGMLLFGALVTFAATTGTAMQESSAEVQTEVQSE